MFATEPLTASAGAGGRRGSRAPDERTTMVASPVLLEGEAVVAVRDGGATRLRGVRHEAVPAHLALPAVGTGGGPDTLALSPQLDPEQSLAETGSSMRSRIR